MPNSSTKDTYGAENTPLKVADTLYVCTPKDIVIALDAQTGKQRWRFDPQVPNEYIPYTAACRGVAYYAVPNADQGAACATRIVEGTLDARIIVRSTPKPANVVRLLGTTDRSIPLLASVGTIRGMFSITSAPTIVRGVIVVGHEVLDGQRVPHRA